MRSDRERLLDILEAIEKIQDHIAQLIVWAAVTVNLPVLKAEVHAVLQELDASGE